MSQEAVELQSLLVPLAAAPYSDSQEIRDTLSPPIALRDSALHTPCFFGTV